MKTRSKRHYQIVTAEDARMMEQLLADPAMDKRLTRRERNMVDLRYGLSGEPPATLQHIASKHGISRERARQIIAQAVNKLELD